MRGLLLIDHGSRRAEANAELGRLAQAIAQSRDGWLVEHAHMELAQPDVVSAVDRLVERGAREILVHLHFLVAGLHVQETIPELLGAARAKHPGLPIETIGRLGEDPRLVEIVVERAERFRPDGAADASQPEG